ncbi:MAG: hypothetical protein KJS91_02830 [Planctomycetes bacterium]|nr:hypothetical protein [Planctomycetota bacterium]
MTRAQLASSDNNLDPDIATGQQVVDQQMIQVNSLPGKGTLSYKGGLVAVGSVIPVSNMASLRYTHTGGDIPTPDSDSFNVTVSDGGGGSTNGSITVTITPVNVAPTAGGAPSLYEGQIKVVAPAINLGDSFDTLANSTIVIDTIVTGNQGDFFIDANGNNILDTGEALSGSVTLSPSQRSSLSTQLKFRHNGAEPNAPTGVSAPSYRISVTDAGGGTGTPAGPVVATIPLSVIPNNDDPTLANSHGTTGTAMVVNERSTTLIGNTRLRISDADRDPADPSNTTPTAQLVYTIGTRPTQGELQFFVLGAWRVLGNGARFTQADVDNNLLRYVQTTNVAAQTADSFTFTVRDSAFGYDVWTDPANPTGGREGGLRNTPTGPIAAQTFHISITPVSGITGGSSPGAPTPGYGPVTYNFDPTNGMLSSNSIAGGSWLEANVGAAGGGYVISSAMLSYTITRTDTVNSVSVVVAPSETVYTLTSQPPHGSAQRQVGSGWQAIATYDQFTQADINANRIRFVHDGSEDHVASFGYTVSDGTAKSYSASFTVDVTPTNDRPGAGGGSAQVTEGDGNAVRLTTTAVGMSDADGSLDGKTGEGLADFLWFRITGPAVDGSGTARGALERWDGSAWGPVSTTDWLPSTLLSASAGGGTSGLRYKHDGSEPLAYTGGAKVSFPYVVRDDLANPGNPFATNTTTPANTDGSAQSNESAPGTTTVNIVPVNNAPRIADKPGDADPTIGGTITDGGVLTGVNEVLAGVPEGAIVTITSAHLTAIDQDSTITQRQFRITSLPASGVLQMNGKLLGVNSTFTQKDIDDGLVSYWHIGAEVGAPITDGLGTYHDKFHFVVNDGVLEDSGTGSPHFNTFLITVAPANRAPLVTAPMATVLIGSTTPSLNPIAGFTIADPDLTNGIITGETDFVQVTVRLLDAATDVPFTNYATGFAGGGVSFGYASQSGGPWAVTQSGTNGILQFQGTRAQVNAALAGLTVTFANDIDATIKLEVIADDRLRNASGVLDASGSDANGGELNEGGGAVPSTVYDWATATVVPAISKNISSAIATLLVSTVNDPAVFTGPSGTATIDEDTRTLITGPFVVADTESAAFGTPVTVTISVPAGHGSMDVAGTGAQTTFTPAGGKAIAISGDNTRSLTLTGRAADIQALLNQRNFADSAIDTAAGLFFTSALNSNHDLNGTDTGDVTITLAFDDAGSRVGDNVGSGSVASNPSNITIPVSITAINDAPVVNGTSTTLVIATAGPMAVGGFSITDVDSDDGFITGEFDFVRAQVRLLDASGNPLALADYGTRNIVLGTTASGHNATVSTTLDGSKKALGISGTLTQVNDYLAGLQVSFGTTLADGNIDTLYSIEVVADDRLRDSSGALTGGANGGANNQQASLPAVPSTDTFDPYATKVATYALYNVTSNNRPLFVSSINDPGSITAANITVNEGNATLPLNSTNGNISIADPDDNGASTLTATVTVGAGTISAVGGSGGTVSGTGTTSVTITGTEAQLNSRLRNITIAFPDPPGAATAANWNGTFTVTVVYRDDGNTGTRPASLTGDTNAPAANPGDFDYEDGTSNVLITTRQITVTVTPVNNAPTRTDANPVTLLAVNEDVPGGAGSTPPGDTVANLFGPKFSDAFDNITGGSASNLMAGIAITTNNAVATQGIWQYSTNGTTWTNLPVVGTTTALLLKPADFLRFVPAANYHGTPGSLVVRLVDNSGGALTTGNTADVSNDTNLSGGNTRFSNSSNAVTLNTTVTNVNDRPAGANATLAAINEDDTNPPGATVATLGFGYSDIIDNQTGITGGGNAATAFGGIAIVGNAANSATEGVWEYKPVSGSWTTIGGGGSAPSDSAAITLPTGASLRFLPNANYNGTPGTLSIRVADSNRAFSASSNISSNLTSTDTWSTAVTLGTTVNKRNDAPAFTHAAAFPTLRNPIDRSDARESVTAAGTVTIDPVNLLTMGAVSDIDLATTGGLNAAVFGAGSITVTLTNGLPGDTLFLKPFPAPPAVQSIVGGTGSTPLVISLNQGTTLSQVKALLEAIQFKHAGSSPSGADSSRAYEVVLSDGNNLQSGGNAGGATALDSATISGTITIQKAISAWLEPWATPFFMGNFAGSTAPGSPSPSTSSQLFADGGKTNLAGLTYLITFSDSVKNLERNAIMITSSQGGTTSMGGGRITSLFNIPGTNFRRWRLDILPTSPTTAMTLSVQVRAGMYRNDAGNTGDQSNIVAAQTFRNLTNRASLAVASGGQALGTTFGTIAGTPSNRIPLTLTLTRPVDASTVTTGAFRTTNATIASISPATGMANTFTLSLDVGASATGAVKVQFTGAGVRDDYGNGALASQELSWRRDVTPPTLLPSTRIVSGRLNQTVSVAVRFSEALSTTTASQLQAMFEIVRSTDMAQTSLGSGGITVSGSGSSFTVRFTITERGNHRLRLKSSGPMPTDIFGNALLSSTTEFSISIT